MALLKSISRLRRGKSLALRSEAGLVFPSGDAAGLSAARPRELGGRSPPLLPAPPDPLQLLQPQRLVPAAPLHERCSEDRAARRLLGLLPAVPRTSPPPTRSGAHPAPGELSRQAPCYGEAAEKQTSRWISITFPVPERALPARRRGDAEAEPR